MHITAMRLHFQHERTPRQPIVSGEAWALGYREYISVKQQVSIQVSNTASIVEQRCQKIHAALLSVGSNFEDFFYISLGLSLVCFTLLQEFWILVIQTFETLKPECTILPGLLVENFLFPTSWIILQNGLNTLAKAQSSPPKAKTNHLKPVKSESDTKSHELGTASESHIWNKCSVVIILSLCFYGEGGSWWKTSANANARQIYVICKNVDQSIRQCADR